MRKCLLWVMAFVFVAEMGYSATIYSTRFGSTIGSSASGIVSWSVSSTTYVALVGRPGSLIRDYCVRTAYGAYAMGTINTTGFEKIVVTFEMAAAGLDLGESVCFQYRTSVLGSWVTIATLSKNTTTFQSYKVTLAAAAGNNTKLQFRFLNQANGTADYGYFDNLTISGTPCVSARTGMGSIPYTGGTMFRVWAPNATTVSVAGSFNSWSTTTTPLVSEGNGYWSRDVPIVSSGAEYQYVINGTMWRKDAYARKQVNSSGNSVVYAPSGATSFTPPAFESQIIYQLHVGSFGASSTSVGHFSDVQSKVTYIKSLGVNMVEFLPVLEFPMDDSWGYNQSDMFAPESYYGGPEALIALVNAFHAQGIGVIFDLVINHMGNGDNALWQYDGWSQNGLGGIYFYNEAWKANTPWGDTRFDYGRSEVRSFLKDQSVYFIEKYQADGLRYDATSFVRYYKDAYFNNQGANPEGLGLMQWINSEVHLKKPSAITIAEDMDNDTSVTAPASSGGCGFNSQWNSYFVNNVRSVCMQANDSDRNMSLIQNALNWSGGAAYNQVNYVESHDEVGGPPDQSPLKTRLCKHIDWSNPHSYYAKKRSTLGGAMALLSRGIPMMFQGQEFMEDKRFEQGILNESIVNMPNWGYQTTYSGILQMYKDLIALRKNYAALRSSSMEVYHVDNTSKLVAFYRNSGSQHMVIIANFANTTWSGNYTIGWPTGSTGHCVFNSDWNGYSSDFGNYGGYTIYPSGGSYDGYSYHTSISIAPYSVLVYDIY